MIKIIINILVIIIINSILLKVTKKTKDTTIKVASFIYIIMFDILWIIYFLDKNNIPTNYNIVNENINTEIWIGALLNGGFTIMSAIIGGLIAFGIAVEQMKENNKQNEEIYKNQNIPLIKYKIIKSVEIEQRKEKDYIKIKNVEEPSEILNLKIVLKNIGLNSAKQVIVDIDSEDIDGKYRLLGEKSQEPIGKDEIIEIKKWLKVQKGKDYKIKLIVYYEDILKNWYIQEINMILNSEDEIKYQINEEQTIDIKDIPLAI